MKTCATLFSGGGLAEVGLKRAGLTPLWAVEYDPAIAAVYARNHGDHVIVGDVRHIDFATLPRPDLLWASPPCPSFSVAKTGRGETETDLEVAAAVVRAIETLRPDAFILENVRGYADSQSYRRIRAVLDSLDYWSDAEVVNAADMGTPQTRERLILRAKAGGWMQAHRPWPAPQRWRGWYEAIEDLIPALPDSAFAPWQLARLPEEIRDSVLVMSNVSGFERAEVGQGVRPPSRPAATVAAEPTGGLPRAFIVDGQESGAASGLIVRHDKAPCFTVTSGTGATRAARAWLVEGTGNQWSSPNATVTTRAEGEPSFAIRVANQTLPKAALPPGRVVALTPRCLARFQGLPDSYWLPDKKSLACRVVGNGVAIEVAYEAARSLL